MEAESAAGHPGPGCADGRPIAPSLTSCAWRAPGGGAPPRDPRGAESHGTRAGIAAGRCYSLRAIRSIGPSASPVTRYPHGVLAAHLVWSRRSRFESGGVTTSFLPCPGGSVEGGGQGRAGARARSATVAFPDWGKRGVDGSSLPAPHPGLWSRPMTFDPSPLPSSASLRSRPPFEPRGCSSSASSAG